MSLIDLSLVTSCCASQYPFLEYPPHRVARPYCVYRIQFELIAEFYDECLLNLRFLVVFELIPYAEFTPLRPIEQRFQCGVSVETYQPLCFV